MHKPRCAPLFPALPCRPLPAAGLVLIASVGLSLTDAAEPEATQPGIAQPQAEKSQAGPTAEQKAIYATAEAFAKAFNNGDAKAVAALWTPQGSFIDGQGAVFKGRQLIEDLYARFFKEHPGAKIEIVVGPVEFPTPTTAVEDGVTRVVLSNGNSGGASRYTAVHVLEGGTWLMAGVRESSLAPPGGYARIKDLQWLVGNWQNKSGEAAVRTEIRWIGEKSFLQRDYTTTVDGKVTSSGTQIIGWDPQTDRVRSWSFDSSGGHGTGTWTPTPDGWRIDSSGTLADGTPTSSVDFVIHVPSHSDVLGWRSINRTVGTVPLPDTREVVLDRVPAEP